MEVDSALFTWPIRVYYEDTDTGGVVYHANYLRFLERARTEWLRSQGWSQQRLKQESGLGFVVASMTIDFRRAARLDDELLATVRIKGRRRVSLDFEQTLVAARDQARIYVEATAQVACVDLSSLKPQRLPDNLAST
jgi:acyl-CoA thioester hydrolase